MISEEKQIILQAVEHFARTGNIDAGSIKMTLLPDNKTSYVETIAEAGRSILLDEYHVEGRVFWAGYSGRAGMVYLSPVR